nr:MAG TPA: hypothetical protein [Caudoviricetes sp.]
MLLPYKCYITYYLLYVFIILICYKTYILLYIIFVIRFCNSKTENNPKKDKYKDKIKNNII